MKKNKIFALLLLFTQSIHGQSKVANNLNAKYKLDSLEQIVTRNLIFDDTVKKSLQSDLLFFQINILNKLVDVTYWSNGNMNERFRKVVDSISYKILYAYHPPINKDVAIVLPVYVVFSGSKGKLNPAIDQFATSLLMKQTKWMTKDIILAQGIYFLVNSGLRSREQ